MDGRMVLYRGSLRSCNYQCSYCPFSKRRMNEKELEKDRHQWGGFVESFMEKGEALGIRAFMVVPYGEAMVHPWYWEGMARISSLPWMDAVGAQTNLSFPVEESLKRYQQAGGRTDKLRFWATFHPEMTEAGEFADRCRRLRNAGVMLSAGAVGVPENLGLLMQLRDSLPEDIYLWINRMDGLGRPYTGKEKEGFLGIDPYFLRELAAAPGDAAGCGGRLFIEGNGGLRTCNISPLLEERWEDIGEKTEGFPMPKCGRKRCSCYLAYGGRDDLWNRMLFGPYSLFRIPRHPKAVFLDIEGTLVPKEKPGKNSGKNRVSPKGREIPAEALAGLEGLSRERTPVFFATTLPLEEALKRCGKVWHLFQGGIFAAGAHLVMERGGEKQEVVYGMEEAILPKLESMKRRFLFRILPFRNQGKIYKLTLLRPAHRRWEEREAEELFVSLQELAGNTIRYFIEENCLQIVSSEASKANGARTLCRWMNILPEETFAVGDSKEDEEMMRLCRHGK